jgi:hypothetical protein
VFEPFSRSGSRRTCAFQLPMRKSKSCAPSRSAVAADGELVIEAWKACARARHNEQNAVASAMDQSLTIRGEFISFSFEPNSAERTRRPRTERLALFCRRAQESRSIGRCGNSSRMTITAGHESWVDSLLHSEGRLSRALRAAFSLGATNRGDCSLIAVCALEC